MYFKIFIFHTGGYIYIEASYGEAGYRAVLKSRTLTATPGSTLTFYYNMYGQDIGMYKSLFTHFVNWDFSTRSHFHLTILYYRMVQVHFWWEILKIKRFLFQYFDLDLFHVHGHLDRNIGTKIVLFWEFFDALPLLSPHKRFLFYKQHFYKQH